MEGREDIMVVMKEVKDREGQKYWVNKDNIEYIAEVGREYAVRFTSGSVLRVDEKTAKELMEGYAKTRKDVQLRPKAKGV